MRLLTAIAVSLVCGLPLKAQSDPPIGGRAAGRVGAGRVGAGRAGMLRPKADARALLEQRLQERVNEIVRTRLVLSDEQFQQLRELSTRAEAEKRALRRDEVDTRVALRRELLAGDRVNESRVSELLDKLPGLERRRIDLMEAEQKDLARFLSPSQRARYFALQDELRRNMQDTQRRRLDVARDGDTTDGQTVPGRGRRLRAPPPPPEF